MKETQRYLHDRQLVVSDSKGRVESEDDNTDGDVGLEHMIRLSRDAKDFDDVAMIDFYNRPRESESEEQYWDEVSLSESKNSPYRNVKTKTEIVTTTTTTTTTQKHVNHQVN